MAQFSCCGIEFRNEEELTGHQVKVHGQQKRVVGTCCGQECYTDRGLKEHQRVEHGKAS